MTKTTTTIVTEKKGILNHSISFGGFSLADRALFAKNMSVMIKSGMTLSESLDLSADSLSGKTQEIVRHIKSSVEAGQPFSESLKLYPKIFSELFINAVYAGETSGSLEENLEHVSEQLRKEKELVEKIRGAMLYPVVILVATFALGMGISFFILPQITPLFEGLKTDLPITTRMLIWFSKLVQDHGIILFSGIIAFIFVTLWLIRQKFSHPFTHKFLLTFPIVGSITKNNNIAKFCRTLATLLKSGLTIDESIRITRNSMGNYYYVNILDDIVVQLRSGAKLSGLLSHYEKYFPKLITRMIHVGEEAGTLEDSLFYLAQYYEEEVDNSTKNLSTAIEPVLLIFIGLVVGFLALSIITPIYDITGSIKA